MLGVGDTKGIGFTWGDGIGSTYFGLASSYWIWIGSTCGKGLNDDIGDVATIGEVGRFGIYGAIEWADYKGAAIKDRPPYD